MISDLHTTDLPARLATASLIGLAVGLEREWSNQTSVVHANPAPEQTDTTRVPHARFAGLRTFFLIGISGGIAGTLIDHRYEIAGAAILIAVASLAIVAYASAVRQAGADFDGTTETAAIVVLALGVLAAFGEMLAAAAVGAVVVLMLGEKARLHWLVKHIAPEELEGALQFAVLALVVLPLLPPGPYGGILDIRPRVIWSIVLLFSALNYCGYVTRRVWGANRGYGLTGVLGGLVSSTAVTLQFSRLSSIVSLGSALSAGVIGACTMLLPRVVVLSAFIDPKVSLALAPRLIVPAIVGVAFFAMTARHGQPAGTSSESAPELGSPLAFPASLRMALLFQLAVSVIAVARSRWGTPGLYASAVALGFTDVDALTVSATESAVPTVLAAQAIVLGIMSNTVLKMTISAVLGREYFRRFTLVALTAMGVACAVSLWIWGWQ